MKHLLRKVLSLSLAAVTALSMSVTAFADEPYNSYNYDTWDDAIPSQSAYRVEKTVTGAEMQLLKLRDPNEKVYVSDNAAITLSDARDLFVDKERKEMWVADTKNNRILCLDLETLVVKGAYMGVNNSSVEGFAAPQGVFVTTSPTLGKQVVYVADTDNSRVVKATVTDERNLECVTEYKKPEEALYTAQTFNPKKVCVDVAENVYAVVNSVNSGSVQFSREGKFTGFYGANRVQVTAAVIAQRIWRAIASDEQLEGMSRNVPIEYANFDIDNDGFIYTVTEVDTDTDAVKKLNPAGYNIWNNAKGNEYKFGDLTGGQWDPLTKKQHVTRLTDLDISDTGLINVMDFETGRVFQYDKECNLVCIFGSKTSTSDQRGTMSNPNAVESYGNRVYILDGSKNDITVFIETQFGKYVHAAFDLYDEGRYVEAKSDWEEVVKRDGSYTYAYIGLGKAALNEEEYNSALKYFKTAYDQDDYDKAYKYAREAFLREHFTLIIIIIALLVILLIVKGQLKKRGIKLIKRKPKRPKPATVPAAAPKDDEEEGE
ncbi:MAG: hypothetical protein IKO27_04405 [Ruminococcus sp.]|nr:hypothetical protein [Ruminococcus sp.]